MPNYNTENTKIKNPLNALSTNRACPLCGSKMCGGKIVDNQYKLELKLWTGNPCTQSPERKNVEIDMCFKCRAKVYAAIKSTVTEIRSKRELP